MYALSLLTLSRSPLLTANEQIGIRVEHGGICCHSFSGDAHALLFLLKSKTGNSFFFLICTISSFPVKTTFFVCSLLAPLFQRGIRKLRELLPFFFFFTVLLISR